MPSLQFEQLKNLVGALSAEEKLLLIGEIARQALAEPPFAEKRPYKSLWGALAHLGPAPSEEDFEEARRAMFADRPREGAVK